MRVGRVTNARAARGGALALAFATVAALDGCAGERVVRVVDGHAVAGPFVSEGAYAEFLRAALKEEHGDLRGALAAFEAVLPLDASSPEVWTRVGRLRCQVNPKDGDAAIDEALRLDRAYGPALAARRFCADVRASGAAVAEATEQQGALEANRRDGRAPFVVRAHDTRAGLDVERERIEARALLHHDRVAAWEALAAWGESHGEVSVAVRGLSQVARLDAARRPAIGAAAVALAGAGYALSARSLAAALFDAGRDGSAGLGPAVESIPLVARLALDAAIQAHDAAGVLGRARRAHVAVAVAGARAWMAGDRAFARQLVDAQLRGDPADLDARLVADGASGRGGSWLLRASHDAPAGAPVMVASSPRELRSADVLLPFAREILAVEGPGAARGVIAVPGGLRVPGGDERITQLAVELALAGALDESLLPPDGRLEFAARRGARPPESLLGDESLDARHRLFLLALLRPHDPTTLAEVQRLSGAAREDPLVAAAIAKVNLARGETVAGEALSRLEASSPSDAIAASALVEAEEHAGVATALARARRRLAALAQTPAEHARAHE